MLAAVPTGAVLCVGTGLVGGFVGGTGLVGTLLKVSHIVLAVLCFAICVVIH